MSNPYLSHLLTRLESDLDFLSSQQLLSTPDLELIKQKLRSIPHSTTVAGSVGGIGGLENGMVSMRIGQQGQGAGEGGAMNSVSTMGQARALWAYNKSQPDDLGFQQGDIIDIVELVNDDWWKGTLNGQTGLFPSNHVERIQPTTRAPPPPPPQSQNNAPYNVGYSQPNASFAPPPPPNHYASPPPPQSTQYAYQQSQYYPSSSSEKPQPQQLYQPPPPPPSQQFVPPPPPSSAPNVVVGTTEEEKKKKKFPGGGQFGKTVGTAFAGGMGFGAGSAITSNAINAIF
ncbi:uncharacterized protein JCM6883_006253 [Sporobolomyces salmoneus]|uniref:uncharacterized protein n=1 Tax=Sporobolomyces salmoneus TaxID=183962 RepID=UPI00317BCE11